MSWRDRLLPASFRGVSFQIEEHQETGGRRVDLRQYPQRDTPSTEDLGRSADGFRIRAFILADPVTQEYTAARDALRKACRQYGPGTLVHPYLGTVSVNCRLVSMRESIRLGGMAEFDIDFIESGLTPSPTLSQNTAASAIAGLQSLLSIAVNTFAIAELVALRPGVLLGFAAGYLGSVISGFSGLPASVLGQIAGTIANIGLSLANGAPQVTSSITGLTGDPVAIAVSDAFSAAATAIATQPQTIAGDPVTGVTATFTPVPVDPTQGLLPFASWGSALPAPSGLQVPLQLALQQQMTGLVQGCAVIAIAQIFAATDWPSSNAAAAAKAQLLDLIEAQILAAAAADNDALYQGFLGLIGLSTADLVQRAQSLPTLTAYTTKTTLPAPVLAQMLLQDGAQWLDLATLNGAVHPSFMPVQGVYLPASP
jgi:prophage DNA circulation protein